MSKQNSPKLDLGLFCLPMSHKKDARLIWVKNTKAIIGCCQGFVSQPLQQKMLSNIAEAANVSCRGRKNLQVNHPKGSLYFVFCLLV